MSSRRRRHLAQSFSFVVVAAFVACGPTVPQDEPTPCEVTAPTECSDPTLRWEHVAPIFENRCSSCHDGRPGSPWPLDDYSHVADWWDVVRDELLKCSMPPADGDETLPPAERDTLLMWLRCGFPE